MSIAFVTTRGTFVIDLFLKKAPMQGFNMIKLAKIGWFNNALFYEIVENYFIKLGQIEEPEGTTIYTQLTYHNIYIDDEISSNLTHSIAGYVSTNNKAKNKNTSEFFITLGNELSRFDGIHTIFGKISENFELITNIAKEPLDVNRRPYRNIRILQTKVLFDPFEDPPGFELLQKRFVPFSRLKEIDRLEDDEVIKDIDPSAEAEMLAKQKEERHLQILEILGDIPDVSTRPPETSIFICKLHPKTDEDGLRIVFSKFGDVQRVDIVRDSQTGNSLCYGFVDFKEKRDAENAFIKMQRAIIDNRRVIVDFCQSIKGPKRMK